MIGIKVNNTLIEDNILSCCQCKLFQLSVMSNQILHRFCTLNRNFTELFDSSYISNKRPINIEDSRQDKEYQKLVRDIFFGTESNTSFNFTVENTSEESICFNNIYENRSDILYGEYAFSEYTDKKMESKNIDILGVVKEARIYFISGYSASNSIQFTNVLDSFTSFSTFSWVLYLMTIMAIYFMFKMSINNFKKRRQKRVLKQRLFFKIISYFMKQNSMERFSLSFNQILLSLTLFMTFFHVLYNCSVHTDFVVAYKPFAPKSYQEIINNKTSLIEFSEISKMFFENSIESSSDRKFYEQIKHRNRNLDEMPQEYREKYYKTKQKGSIFINLINLLFGLHISFLEDIRSQYKLNRLCSIKVHSNEELFQKIVPNFDHELNLKEVYPWISSDKETHRIMILMTKRKGFIPHVSITNRVSRIRQAGMEYLLEILENKIEDVLHKSFPEFKNKEKEMHECHSYSKVVKLYEVDSSALNFENIKWLFLILFILFLVSFIVLFFEKWIFYH